MKDNFLLNSQIAQKLYNEVASKLPIIDYHNHLSVGDISNDKKFENITKLWISVDPYKHRAMRILGVSEKYITGDATDKEKFEQWYKCLPKLVGNPLFDWSVMEFSKVLEMELLPFSEDYESVWNKANQKLEELSAKKILEKFNIEYSAPCASLVDDLSLFNKEQGLCPSLRGDDIVLPNKETIKKLEQITNIKINSLEDYEKALQERLQAFINSGCKYCDHALDNGFEYYQDDGKNQKRFKKLLKGKALSAKEKQHLSSKMLKFLAENYAEQNLVMQLHIGAQRTTSSRLRKIAGVAGGYAAIGNGVNVKSLTELLDDIEKSKFSLPKTLLFTLNPADNAVMAILSGSYSKDSVESVVSQGPAWWWCDHYQGMREMLDNFSVYSVLSTFHGMTTDSRSLLSFVRHDYFRRILCQWIGEKVEKGSLHNDFEILSETVKNICYINAKKYL